MQAYEGDFGGTARFEIVRRLGAGGMGVVYEALDREHGAHVALKTLRSFDARTILHIKQESRAPEGLQHPNLVQLGDLIEEGGRWFFTMELVRGVDFLSHVRRCSPVVARSASSFRTGPSTASSTPSAST